ncbi:MAG: TraE/TraK family type IV conjugative transfer system protein [Pseudomonadota bacterium]
MSPQQQGRQLRSARGTRNVFILIALALLVANLMLVGSYTQIQRTTVLVPSRISDGMVAAGAVDSRYVESLALDAVYAFYNVSPETAAYGRRVVERLSSVRDRPRLLDSFDAVAEDIRERRITTTFFPERLDHDQNGLRIVVTGNLATFIETQRVTQEERVITLIFVEEASSVRLASMTVEETSS